MSSMRMHGPEAGGERDARRWELWMGALVVARVNGKPCMQGTLLEACPTGQTHGHA